MPPRPPSDSLCPIVVAGLTTQWPNPLLAVVKTLEIWHVLTLKNLCTVGWGLTALSEEKNYTPKSTISIAGWQAKKWRLDKIKIFCKNCGVSEVLFPKIFDIFSLVKGKQHVLIWCIDAVTLITASEMAAQHPQLTKAINTLHYYASLALSQRHTNICISLIWLSLISCYYPKWKMSLQNTT